MQYSVVNYSYVYKLPTLRFDSEYYHSLHLKYEKIVKNKSTKFIPLSKLGLKIDASAFYPSLEPFYGLGNMPFLRVTDINTKIDYENCITIPISKFNEYKTLKKGNKGDIVITKGGSIARVGLIEKESALCRDLIFINSSKLSQKDHVFLFYYCFTDLYKNLLIRSSSMTAQPHLTLTLVKDILIFEPRNRFKELILKIHILLEKNYQLSKKLFKDSQNLLLSELGLENWKPKHKLAFVKNYSDAKVSERIDAKYFQPIYFNTERLLKEKFKAKSIGEYDFLDITTGQYTNNYVLENEGNPYIRGTDLFNASVNTDNLVYISKSNQAYSKKAREGDVVVTRVGTIGISSRIPKECDGGTISDNLIRIRIKDQQKLNPYYLALYLNTELGKNFMIRASRGSVQQRLNQETLKEIILPIININKQKEIANIIIRSQNQQNKSKSLLEIAKKSVEIAIEKDEETAENWIKNEVNKLGVKLNA